MLKSGQKTYHYFGMEMNDHLFTSKNMYHSFQDQQRKNSMQNIVVTSLHENKPHTKFHSKYENHELFCQLTPSYLI